mgnify:FL=1
MADKRYAGGVLAGIAKERTPGDWPLELPGLGPRERAQLGRCVDCDEAMKASRNPQFNLDGGWFTYGGRHLCKRHAIARERREP